jgi:signal transduction histidine kinase/ActR/RegA family two-component response regulator
MMAPRKLTIRARATVAAAAALVITAIAFGVALFAAGQSQDQSRELADRLVPASITADDLVANLTAQQSQLRDAVTQGKASGLALFEAAGAAAGRDAAKLAQFGQGDPPMTSQLGAVTAARQAWLVNVADPQAAALRRGDVAAAQALQADTAHVSPYVLAVRTSGLALQTEIAGEQQALTSSLNEAHDTLLGALIAMVVVAAAIAAEVVIGVWRGMFRPLTQLATAVNAVADGSYDTPVPTVGPPELANLGRGVELMRTRLVAALSERVAIETERERLRAAAEQERLQKWLQQSQRLESLGQLVGGVAHDFNNLLGIICGYTEFAAEELQPLAAEDERLVPLVENIEQVQAAAQQAIRVTRQLLTFAKAKPASPEVLDVNDVIESAGLLVHRALGERIELVEAAGTGLWPVEADRGQLEQVLMNLAVNARDAMPDGGRLTITTANVEVDDCYAAERPGLAPGRYCRLSVADTGTGMDAETVDRVFEPFFSTKPRGRGTGLGLATVYGIVSGLGGVIDVSSEPGFGTTMNVLLPVSPHAAAAVPEARPSPEKPRGHGEVILLVEDEHSLRTMASRILARNGYVVREAADGAEAVRLAAEPGGRVDLLVTDMVMPGMLGNEVVDRVHALRPGLPALFITGHVQQVLDFHGIAAPDLDIVQKPFTEAVLLARVRQSLDKSRHGAPT